MTPISFKEAIESRIFKDEEALLMPRPPSGKFVHREVQHNSLIIHLSPILKNRAGSNVFVYGLPGTGKTALTLQVIYELKKEAEERNILFEKVYVNCAENRTDATIISCILQQLIREREIPRIGWNRAKLIDELKMYLDKPNLNVLIILDEIDHTLKSSGDDILYTLSRINEVIKARVSTITISNDVNIMSYINPKVSSSFGRNKIIFTPYNANELITIMKDRIDYAFQEGVVGEGLLEKIAGMETSRRGDAREALKLLYNCALTAIEENKDKLSLDLVDKAYEKLDNDAYIGILSALPMHQKILYLSILKNQKRQLTSDDVYHGYSEYCRFLRRKPLTDRMVRTFLMNFDNMGLIHSDIGWIKSLKKKARRISVPLTDEVRVNCMSRLKEALL